MRYFTIRGRIKVEIVADCPCCGQETIKTETIGIDRRLIGDSEQDVVDDIELSHDYDFIEWKSGPVVTELPTDQVLRLQGAPMLPLFEAL